MRQVGKTSCVLVLCTLCLWLLGAQPSQPPAQYRIVALLSEQETVMWNRLVGDISKGHSIEKICEDRKLFLMKERDAYILISKKLLTNENEIACNFIDSLLSSVLMNNKFTLSEIRHHNFKEYISITNWLEMNSIYQLPNASQADFTLREIGVAPVGIVSCEVGLSNEASLSLTLDVLSIGDDFETQWKKQEAYTKPKRSPEERSTSHKEDHSTVEQHRTPSQNSMIIRSVPSSLAYDEIAILAQVGLQYIIEKSIIDKQRYNECLLSLKNQIKKEVSYHDLGFEQPVLLERLPSSAQDAIMGALERYRKAHNIGNVSINSVRLLIHPGVKIGLLLRDQGGYMGAVVDLENESVVKLFYGGPVLSEGSSR